MNDDDNQDRPKIKLRGIHTEGNVGHGMYFNCSADLDIDGFNAINNAGDNLHVAEASSLIAALDLPPNTDPKALAEILTVLIFTPAAEREQVIKESGFFKSLSVAGDSSSLIAAISNIATNPDVHGWIQLLLK